MPNVLDEAREVLKHQYALYDGPTLKRIIKGLIQIIDTERLAHRQHVRELQRDVRDACGIAAAEALLAQNEFGGRDM